MNSRNIIDKYGNVTGQSNAHRPAQGYASDSYLEKRQQIQRQQQNLETSDEAYEKLGISSFAGVTESTRVRKPPGGDTNDIFGMEDRQKLQAREQKLREKDVLNYTHSWKKNISISADQEKNCAKESSDFCSLLNQLSASTPFKASSNQVDKENLNTQPDRADSFDDKLTNQLADNYPKNVDGVEEEQKCSKKRFIRRNPITGDVIEVEVTVRSKLADCSNVGPTQDRAQMTTGFEAHRTSVRVRQPPGGASSNIF